MSNLRQQGGVSTLIGPWGTPTEQETFTCFHCNRIVFVTHKAAPEDVGGLCKHCMKLVCPDCVDQGVCAPWEEQMLRAEARQEALRSYGMP